MSTDLRDAEPCCEHCGERIRWAPAGRGRLAGMPRSRWEHVRTGWPRCNVEGLAFAAPMIALRDPMIDERAEAGEL